MVYFSDRSRDDLNKIFESLLQWETANHQKRLTYNMVVSYHNNLLDVCEGTDKLPYHRKATYPLHKRFGEFVCQYKRNPRTLWYIIYNLAGGDVFVERIINNYKTV